MCVINNSLSNETIKSFIYCLHPSLTMDECFNSIIKYVKHITAIGTDIPTPTALMVEQEDINHRRPPYIVRCFYCHEPGHKEHECPHRPTSSNELTNTPGYYRHIHHSEVIVRPPLTQIDIHPITHGLM